MIILLDQFTRNVYRKSAQAFSGDEKAQKLTLEALEKGWFWVYGHLERGFMLMPLMHAEDKAIAAKSVEMFQKHLKLSNDIYPGQEKDDSQISFAIKHKDVIDKFGRYPYRNAALGRETTSEETEYLKTAETFGQ